METVGASTTSTGALEEEVFRPGGGGTVGKPGEQETEQGSAAPPVNTPGPGLNTASKTWVVDDREYSNNVIYSCSDQESDCGDNQDTGRFRWGQERGER